ncbi:hypothetical protein O181_040824 [Austropuccinia psidii MF-1]|uniref:Integrase catalytic domain-containing protein n=1 Tax=Austropuccinia psidii MF-1 TaxID=1389203 RepID=A0A9Q3DD21_9BASI|nr:hypothetical protein [Austropuccinia psidii MF-1]
MNDQSSLRQNLPELTTSNYLQWKIQIQAYLMEMDLIDCITSNSEEISDASRQAEAVRRQTKTAEILIGTMGILNCQRFLAVVNEANPYNIWQTLSKHFTSNAEDNQARIFLEFLALKNEGSLEQFITNVTQHISKIASVGIMIGSPGGIKEALVAEIILLHARAGHPSIEILRRMFKVTIPKIDCEACALSKSHRLPYSGVLPTAVKPLEFIHMDLSGRISLPTIGGAQYYFKITDQFTSFKYVFLLKNKSKAFHYFQKFCSIAFSLFQIYPINAIMDNGGEFVSSAFKAYFEKLRIQSHFTAPYKPQQNPVSKRGNRTTSEKACLLLKHAHLPNQLWGEAVITAIFYEIISPENQNTPSAFQMWYGKAFDSSCLRVIGCKAFVNIEKNRCLGKFSDTSKVGILVGYQLGQHNWRILFPDMTIVYSHDAVFHESVFPGKAFFTSAVSSLPLTEYLLGSTDTQEVCAENPSLNSSTPSRLDSVVPPPAPPSVVSSSTPAGRPGWDVVLLPAEHLPSRNIDSNIGTDPFDTSAITLDFPDQPPKAYRQALVSADSESWLQADDVEKTALEQKVFDGNGRLVKHKARLCAQGCAQIKGLEYGETYAPTGAMATLRFILTIGISNGWEIHQMDAKTAFLNSMLNEVIYLRSPSEQSPRCWYQELVSFFKTVGFSPSLANSCLFISQDSSWPCLVHVHVDDMTIVIPDVSRFKRLISSSYNMDDLGPIRHILGIKVCQDTDVLSLSQNTLIEKILAEYGMAASKSVTTPLNAGTYLLPARNEDHRTFLSLGVNYHRAFLSYRNILRSLTQLNLRVYADTSYANCPVSRRYHTGLMIFLDNTLIHWKSRRQPSVSSSSTKAEYKALYDGAQQVLWFCKLFNDVSLGASTLCLTVLGDNQPSIALAKNPLASV